METIETLDQSGSGEVHLGLTDQAKRFLSEAGKWGRFISIVGFIAIGLMVVFGIFAGTVFGKLAGNEMPFPPALFSVIYIIIAALYFFPVLYLFRFSTKIREALNSNNESVMQDAFENLKSHYKFIGILMIVMLVLYGLGFVGGVLFGALAM